MGVAVMIKRGDWWSSRVFHSASVCNVGLVSDAVSGAVEVLSRQLRQLRMRGGRKLRYERAWGEIVGGH